MLGPAVALHKELQAVYARPRVLLHQFCTKLAKCADECACVLHGQQSPGRRCRRQAALGAALPSAPAAGWPAGSLRDPAARRGRCCWCKRRGAGAACCSWIGAGTAMCHFLPVQMHSRGLYPAGNAATAEFCWVLSNMAADWALPA